MLSVSIPEGQVPVPTVYVEVTRTVRVIEAEAPVIFVLKTAPKFLNVAPDIPTPAGGGFISMFVAELNVQLYRVAPPTSLYKDTGVGDATSGDKIGESFSSKKLYTVVPSAQT